MKSFSTASSIVTLLCLLSLVGCGNLGMRNIFAQDQVPPTVKAEPRLVESAPAETKGQPWPLLGTVPFAPKDFSPPIVYNHYMNELEYHRDEAVIVKQQAKEEDEAIAPSQSLPEGTSMSAPLGQANKLVPPQLSSRPME